MTIESYLAEIEKQLPEFADTTDLIRAGVFTSFSQAVKARERGECPEFVTLSRRRIMYPRACVLNWLRQRACTNASPATL